VWRGADFQIEAGDFVLVRACTDTAEVEAMFYAELRGPVAVLRRLDIQGAGANSLGSVALRKLTQWVMEFLDVDELRIEGAARTSGAGAGRRPPRIAAI
jgi:hypothetical protein